MLYEKLNYVDPRLGYLRLQVYKYKECTLMPVKTSRLHGAT